MEGRSLRMREVRWLIPRISKSIFLPTTVGTMGTVKPTDRDKQTWGKEIKGNRATRLPSLGNQILWGCSSNGTALASHTRGTAIDTPNLQIYFITNNFRIYGNCGVVPTETNNSEAKNSKETEQLDYPVWATRSNGDVARRVELLASHARGTMIDTPHLQSYHFYQQL